MEKLDGAEDGAARPGGGYAADRLAVDALFQDAVDRTIAVLDEYREVMDRLDVEPGAVRMTATLRGAATWRTATTSSPGPKRRSACGPSSCRATRRPGCPSPARPSGLAKDRGPFLVFDLGGGSTEFAYGHDEVEAAVSIDVGCVRLTERFIEHDPPQPEELVAAISYTESWLDDVDRAIPSAREATTVIGLAGTVSTVVAVEIGLATYDRDRVHHFVLTRDAAEDVFRTLATETRGRSHPQPGARGGEGRRDRRRLLRPRGDHAPLRPGLDRPLRGRHPRRPRAQRL